MIITIRFHSVRVSDDHKFSLGNNLIHNYMMRAHKWHFEFIWLVTSIGSKSITLYSEIRLPRERNAGLKHRCNNYICLHKAKGKSDESMSSYPISISHHWCFLYACTSFLVITKALTFTVPAHLQEFYASFRTKNLPKHEEVQSISHLDSILNMNISTFVFSIFPESNFPA